MPDTVSILVAVDESATLPDLSPIFRLARSTGWRVDLVHAAAPEPAFVGYDEEDGVYDRRRRDTELADLRTDLRSRADVFTEEGLSAETFVVVGPTVEAILKHAEAYNAAFIAIVGHKHSVLHRVMLGSVASTLLKVSPVPVLVMPPASDEVTAGFTTAVSRLIDRIDREEPTTELTELREAATRQLDEPESSEEQGAFLGRLRESISQFGTDHPSLTQAINDVGYYLSGAGV